MIFAEDMWLRGKAAQSSMMQLMAYNTAFAGTAALQAMKMGLTGPSAFWQAMGRASGSVVPAPEPAPKAPPKPEAKAKTTRKAPAKPKAAMSGAAVTDAPAPKPKPKAARKPKAVPAPSPAPEPVAVAPEPLAAAPEPVAVAPVPEATPAPETAGPSPHLLDAPRGGKADDLTVLTGVGAKLATSLSEFGIYHFDQIATLDAEGIDWLNEQQPGFKMLCARYNLVDQARARLA